MNALASVRQVLQEYCLTPGDDAIRACGSLGGFSGAQFWRIAAESGELCLRRWPPEHPNPDRLSYIHSVLRFAAEQGFAQLPVPQRTRTGASFVRADGALWELSDWVAGEPDSSPRPGDQRITSAMQALALFHRAVAGFGHCSAGPAPGLIERKGMLSNLLEGQFDLIREQAGGGPFAVYLRQISPSFWALAPRLAEQLDALSKNMLPLQPCLRDARSEHFLFAGDELVGIVDFGAVREDYATGDIARLLGSWFGDQQELRAVALEAYHRTRPLNDLDRQLVDVYDACNVLLSPLNWLRWILLENRQFDEPERVQARLDECVARLARATSRDEM